jgi:putative serine protease PepD
MNDEQRDGGRHDEQARSAEAPPAPATPRAYPNPGYGGYGPAPGWGGTATAERHTDPYPTATLPAERPKRSRGMTGVVTAALIAGLVGGGAGFGGAYALPRQPGPHQVPAPRPSARCPPPPGPRPRRTAPVAGAAAAAAPSTVDIRVVTSQGVAEGSGVILTADGAVLTNNHVVSGSNGTISVTLADGSEHTATVVGTSPSYDLAVLRMQNVSGLTAATLGRSADLQVGQQVVAIGSPQGLTGTVTAGIVSALNRTVGVQGEDGSAVVYNGLQTDAPINQGNSGGPLVNLDGQVIGINSAIATAGQSSGSIGLGFTIPIDQARRVAQEILDTGSATKPVLGCRAASRARSRSRPRGGRHDRRGAGRLGGRAAGLKAGDVVTKVGDATSRTSRTSCADRLLRPRRQGHADRASGGATKTVDVTLGSTKDEAATTSTHPSSSNSPFGQSPFEQQQSPSASSRTRSAADRPQRPPLRSRSVPSAAAREARRHVRGPSGVPGAERTSRGHVNRTGCPVDSSTAIHRSPRGSTCCAGSRQRHRQVHEPPPPAARPPSRAARHRRVHRRLRQPHAVDAVVGVGRHAADGVAGVDVADRGLQPGVGEVVADAPAQVGADVLQAGVARRVPAGVRVAEQVLAGALGHHDDRVPALLDPRRRWRAGRARRPGERHLRGSAPRRRRCGPGRRSRR